MEFLEFEKKFDVCLTKFKNNQISANKISHRFLLITICWLKDPHYFTITSENVLVEEVLVCLNEGPAGMKKKLKLNRCLDWVKAGTRSCKTFLQSFTSELKKLESA